MRGYAPYTYNCNQRKIADLLRRLKTLAIDDEKIILKSRVDLQTLEQSQRTQMNPIGCWRVHTETKKRYTP